MEAREAESSRMLDWFEQRQAEGALRADIPSVELGRYATAVINGLALRIVGDDPFDIEAAIRLLNDSLAPR
jgi:hypothetical protein